jgi:hypothetical protein
MSSNFSIFLELELIIDISLICHADQIDRLLLLLLLLLRKVYFVRCLYVWASMREI